jgi:hypothetical protein
MSELESRLLELGVSEEEVRTLSRWDRMKVLQTARTTEKEAWGREHDERVGGWKQRPHLLHEPTTRLKQQRGGGGVASNSTSMPAIASPSPDFRLFSMSELESILLEMGMEGHEVRGLGRWDRVRVIRFAATEAKKLGHTDQFWQYARDIGNMTSS